MLTNMARSNSPRQSINDRYVKFHHKANEATPGEEEVENKENKGGDGS